MVNLNFLKSSSPIFLPLPNFFLLVAIFGADTFKTDFHKLLYVID